MANANQDPARHEAARRGGAGGAIAQRFARTLTRRQLVPAASWLLSVVLAMMLSAHAAGTGASWNALRFAALMVLFAV